MDFIGSAVASGKNDSQSSGLGFRKTLRTEGAVKKDRKDAVFDNMSQLLSDKILPIYRRS